MQQSVQKGRTNQMVCSECKTGDFIRRCHQEGSIVCEGCGQIIQQNFIDQSAEWRNFADGNQNGVDLRRGGGIVNTYLQHNGAGTQVQGGQNQKMYQDFENKMIESKDRAYNLAYQDIKDWAHILKLPMICVNKCMEYYEKIHASKLFKGKKNVKAFLSAILFSAARGMDNAIQYSQICEVNLAKISDVQKYYNEIKNILPMKSTSPKVFVNNFCNKLKMPLEINNNSQDIAEKLIDLGLIDGKNPRSIASVSILIGVYLQNNDIQKQLLQRLPDVAGISETTIKNNYKIIYPYLKELMPTKLNLTFNQDLFPQQLSLNSISKNLDNHNINNITSQDNFKQNNNNNNLVLNTTTKSQFFEIVKKS